MPFIPRARGVLAAVRGALSADDLYVQRAVQPDPIPGIAARLRLFLQRRLSPPVQPDIAAARIARGYAEPQVRSYVRWTPADLKGALILADGGNLQRAADLCEAILGDDRAPAVLATRVNAVLGSDLTFERGKGKARKADSAIKKLEADEDWYTAFDEATLGYLLLWGRLLGISPAQNCWHEFKDHGGRLIPVVENWHARHLRLDTNQRQWYIKVGDLGEETKVAPGDGKWIIFTPYGKNRPWSHGLWRGMSRLWLLKQYALDDWGRHSELHGQGIKVGIPPTIGDTKHGNKKVRQELADDMSQLAGDGTIVLPPGFDFKLVEASANTWEMFKAQIDVANAGMSILAIGSNLPTEVGNGAQTGATAQHLVRLDYKKADAEAMSTMAHDQDLTWWAEFNFGDRGLAPWPVWDVEPPADQKAQAEVLKTVSESLKLFSEAGAPVDQRMVLETYEIPATEETEAPVPALPAPVDRALTALASAHTIKHPEPHEAVAAKTLRLVWSRGASLAPYGEREHWGMERVQAFLGLLATGAAEHPEYTADDDLLPDGHDRKPE